MRSAAEIAGPVQRSMCRLAMRRWARTWAEISRGIEHGTVPLVCLPAASAALELAVIWRNRANAVKGLR